MPDEAGEALVIDPDLQLTLRSHRLDRFLADGSLPCLVLGATAEEPARLEQEAAALHAQGRTDWFEASGAEVAFVRDGDALRLRDDLYFTASPSLVDNDLQLRFAHRGGERWSIPLDSSSLVVLGELLGRCQRHRSIADLRAAIDDDDWALLEHLQSRGVIRRMPIHRPARRDDHRVTLVGHSCLLVETPASRVVIDPLLVTRHPARPDLRRVLDEPLDAVVLSHPHWDHANLDTLLLVERTTQIVVPALAHPASIVNVDLGDVCRQLGFTDVVRLAPNECWSVGDIAVEALPYYGEGSGEEGHQDWMTYRVEAGGRSVVGFVDACADAFGSMDDVAAALRSAGPTDVLFAPVSDFWFRTARYHRRPFYLGLKVEQFTGSAVDALRWATLLDASLVVPYAMFDFAGDDGTTPPLDEQRGRYGDAVALLRRERPDGVAALRPGDGLAWHLDGPLRQVVAFGDHG